MARIGIVGGTGYTGAELLRLLVHHPSVEVVAVTARAEAGTRVDACYPHLRGRLDLTFREPAAAGLHECDLVFFATPNGTAMAQAPALLAAGVRVIDLAADFRLKDRALWEHWYGMTHLAPEWLAEAVYGLPEINREAIRSARLVANPGCYPTAVTLGLLPLVAAEAVALDQIIADVKSGISGAGRKPATGLLMAEAGESFKAYSVHGHRHHPEIVQNLRLATGRDVGLTFVPHLLPMIRGIQASLYAPLRRRDLDLPDLYRQRYAGEPFVDLMPADLPVETRSVRGTNLCRMAVSEPLGAGMVLVQAVIDNLVKGAAGQAIQNMNLMLGFPEQAGLALPALVP